MTRTEYVELPLSIRGATVRISEDEYLVLINKLLPEEEQREALEHEELHIKLRHFDRNLTVDECEREVRQVMTAC